MRLGGLALDEYDEYGERVTDDTLLILINSHAENVDFKLPTSARGLHWDVVVDTSTGKIIEDEYPVPNGSTFDLPARSLVLLRRHDVDEDD
jgi:isoamylase